MPTRNNPFYKEDTSRDSVSQAVIGAAIEIHKVVGPGLLESAYEDCMLYELHERGIFVERQRPLHVQYKKLRIPNAYKLDLVVERQLVIELKTVESILWIHEAQLLTYLKLSGIKRGLLLNFNVPLLKDGIKRMIF